MYYAQLQLRDLIADFESVVLKPDSQIYDLFVSNLFAAILSRLFAVDKGSPGGRVFLISELAILQLIKSTVEGARVLHTHRQG